LAFGPSFIFLFLQRFSQKGIQHKGRLSVYITNFGIIAVALLLGTNIGFKNYLMIQLPRIAQWFTGNIGLHHIHLLNPAIPNYNLQACHNEIHRIRPIKPMGIRKSLKSLRIHLWDENTKRLISFKAMNRIRKLRRKKDTPHDQ
jgi:omega-6 fatty acid desaturase (delta-12 desaturase)